jgi:hypothetical protein
MEASAHPEPLNQDGLAAFAADGRPRAPFPEMTGSAADPAAAPGGGGRVGGGAPYFGFDVATLTFTLAPGARCLRKVFGFVHKTTTSRQRPLNREPSRRS